MIKARASGSKVYLYFMKKGRQARHRIPRNSCLEKEEFRVFTIYGHDGYLGHVTWTKYIKFLYPLCLKAAHEI